jgi:hypothetical protein
MMHAPVESKTNWWLVGAISILVGVAIVGIAKSQETKQSDPVPTHH